MKAVLQNAFLEIYYLRNAKKLLVHDVERLEKRLAKEATARQRENQKLRRWLENAARRFAELRRSKTWALANRLRFKPVGAEGKGTWPPLEDLFTQFQRWDEDHPLSAARSDEARATPPEIMSPGPAPTADVLLYIGPDAPDLTRCLDALNRCATGLSQVIAVDDGGTSVIREQLEAFRGDAVFPVTLIRNVTPAGLAPSLQRALELAPGDLVVVLDSSTVVTPLWVEGLIEAMQTWPEAGLITPETAPLPGEPGRDLCALFDAALQRRQAPLEGRDPPTISPGCFALTREALTKADPLEEAPPNPTRLVAHLQDRLRNHKLKAVLAGNTRVYTSSPPGLDPMVTAIQEHVPECKVLFLLPFRGHGGGIHSIVQEIMGLNRLGIFAQGAVRESDLAFYRNQYPSAPYSTFFGFSHDLQLQSHARHFDIVAGTLFTSIQRLKQICRDPSSPLPGYYIQDYEPMFYDPSDPYVEEALESYRPIPGMFYFAKTEWLCRKVAAEHGVTVHRVKPSLDTAVYHPGTPRPDEPFVISAMIRPQTPRRSPRETWEILRDVKRRFADRVHVIVFGSSDDDPFWQSVDRDIDFENRGVLTREEVAETLRQAHLFIDLSTYQAFGRTGLEAMACGCTAILPVNGGTTEYAEDEVNAFLCSVDEPGHVMQRITQLIEDPALRDRLQGAALKTANRYSIEKAAKSEKELFLQMLSQRPEPSHS